MKRRIFLKTAPSVLLGSAAISGAVPAVASSKLAFQPLRFRTPCSIVDKSGDPLSSEQVAVWSELSAERSDGDGDGDQVATGRDRFPLVAIDGNVVGLGSPIATGEYDFSAGNEEFLVNLLDYLLGSGTVVWEQAHDQAYDFTDDYSAFSNYAIEQGYRTRYQFEFEAALEEADALITAAPQAPYSESERQRLKEFVDSGGVVLLYGRGDELDAEVSTRLNQVCSALEVSFRFNDDVLTDSENNAGSPSILQTTQFNSNFPLFSQREGLSDVELETGREYVAEVIDLADADTVTVRFGNGRVDEVRLLGIDSPETRIAAEFERAQEWEGLAYADDRSLMQLRIDSTCSLHAPGGERLTDPGTVAVWAEPNAYQQDTDDQGQVVEYGDADVPLVAAGDGVVGFGAVMVASDPAFQADNEEFLLNVWDEYVGSGTVLWDEGHGQFYSLQEVGDTFPDHAEDQGYEVVATEAIADDLADADAAVITSPGEGFSGEELDALREFVDDGGAVFLHDQADYRNFDETSNANRIASALEAPFRFNDDQVMDPERNGGEPFIPVTGNFSAEFPDLFADRTGVDGAPSRSSEHLVSTAADASEFATERLLGEEVRLVFDEAEGLRDPFDRLLTYLYYDEDGTGARDTLYNEQVISEGLCRVYGSDLSKHREFWLAETEAREADRGVWSESDISSAPPYRNRSVESVFFPKPASVRTTDGELARDRAPVRATSTATQEGSPEVTYDVGIPLVGVDPGANVAVVGAPTIDHAYEPLEGYDADTTQYENYVLVANLVAALSETDGDVLIDGGHGQFGADHAVASESAAYFQRFLEGQSIGLEQRNTLSSETLDGRALIVSTPQSSLTLSEVSAIEDFRDAGGAVILLGSGEAPGEKIGYLNELAEQLGTDLRFNADRITDEENLLDDDPAVFETASFATPYGGLFEQYDGAVSMPQRARREPPTTTTAGSEGSTTTAEPTTATTTSSGTTVGGDDSDGGGGGLSLSLIAGGGAVAAGLGALGLRRMGGDGGGGADGNDAADADDEGDASGGDGADDEGDAASESSFEFGDS
jgi:endonuclease YncB( thermonuclease family)